MTDDAELLRQFAEEDSDAAFRELVAQRIDFVYSAALRQVGGDAHLAQDVVQSVFFDLARKARSLAQRPSLAGWLYTSARFAAGKALRARSRRQRHETEAHFMNETLAASSAAETNWNELRPVLDEAMHELDEKDREAILLRFFENRPLAEVGAALGLGENSARMRVDRALEKLRARLARRGITSTAVALGGAIMAQPAISAPGGIAALVAQTALAGAAAVGGSASVALGALKFMSMTKVTLGALGVVAAIGLGVFLKGHGRAGGEGPAGARMISPDPEIASLREENLRLKAELAQRTPVARPAGSESRVAAAATRTKPSAAALERLRVLADLQRRKLASSDIKFVTAKAKLEPTFTELFALTPAEQEALQGSLDSAREKLAELERAHATVSRAGNGDVVIAVEAFPEAGGAAYDALLRTFAETLGPERQDAFLALGAEQVEKALGRFGAPKRTLTFSRNGPSGGQVYYHVNEAFKLPNENGNYNSDFRSFDEMAGHVGSVAQLLPADFQAR